MNIMEDEILGHCQDANDLGLRVYANLVYMRSDVGRLLDALRDLKQENESLRAELTQLKTAEKILHAME